MNTDDNIQIEHSHIVARSIALADAQTTANDTSDKMEIPQAEVKPKNAVVPTKLWNSDDVCIQKFFTMEQIDVTNGNWHDVPIAHTTGLNLAGNLVEDVTADMLAISFNDLMGIPTGYQNVPTWSSRETRSQNNLHKYCFGKLNSLTVQLGNFSVTIERDASGGIQFKDDPLFEVCFTPTLSIVTESEYSALMPNSSYTSNLSEGISLGMDISSSLIILDELGMKYKVVASTPPKWVWYYPTVAQYLSNKFPDNVSNDITMPPRSWLNTPTYACKIRMINVPRGVSNIKVYLAYTSHVKAHWSAHCYQDENNLQFPPMGSVIPKAIENVPLKIIRQIHPRDPLAIYLSVERNKIEYDAYQSRLLNKYKKKAQ